MRAPRTPTPSLDVTALESLPDAVLALGADDEITYCNAAAETLYGLPHDEMIDRPFGEVVSCSSMHGLVAGRAIHSTSTNPDIPVLVEIVKCARNDGPHRMIAIIRDDREHAALAAALEKEGKRLERMQNEIAHFGRVSAMAELASVIAHELDQPLTAVVSNAQAIRYLLQSDAPDHLEVDAALADVIDAGLRISEIIKSERRLLRKSELKAEPVDLNEIIHEIELFIRAEARHDGATLTLDLAPTLPPIMADRIQLQQVILNVARNGLQAMTSQPREQRILTIRTASTSQDVTVSIIDAGPPIDDAHLRQMFEPFFSTKPSGLGMGLSIGKTIVESHHGRIWATRNPAPGPAPAPAHGITMHITFPPIEADHVNEQRHRAGSRR